MSAITSFTGEHRWLSNFWPCAVVHDGVNFMHAEGAYQAAKCETQDDYESFRGLTPGQAKRRGRQVVMRCGWDAERVDVMREIIADKFSERNPTLRDKLIATGDAELIEGNTWNDTFWGVCNGVGENWLGRLLMERRAELQAVAG